jgi:IMP dehydrogenase
MDSIRRVYAFSDLLICPRNSELEHLTDADITYTYDKCANPFTAIPVINAPMDTVCSAELLNLMNKMNLPTTVHRWFKTVDDQIAFVNDLNYDNVCCFVSVGIVSKWKVWIDSLLEFRIKSKRSFGILIDVANGDTKAVVDTIKYIRTASGQLFNINIMAGNVATKSGFSRLQDAGADFIRVGIGGSSICATRLNIGVGLPTATSIFDCSKVVDKAYLIADGGISHNGDICKAIAAGAHMAMCGKLFAATDLANNKKYDKDMVLEAQYPYNHGFIPKYCKYRGMASKEANALLNSKKTNVSIEGVEGLIPYKGKTEDVINEMIGNLQSAVAYYGGCRTWDEFRRKVKFVEITSNGWEESKTRVL